MNVVKCRYDITILTSYLKKITSKLLLPFMTVATSKTTVIKKRNFVEVGCGSHGFLI